MRAAHERWRAQTPVWFGVLVGVVLTTAAVAALTPDFWHQVWVLQSEQRTDASARLFFTIWLTNFSLCVAPLFVGAVVHAARRGGATRGRMALLVAATVLQMRNPIAIGSVGGLDPQWLAAAAPWWLMELGAMAIALGAMWRAWATTAHRSARRLLTVATMRAAGLLLVASAVELALT